jgi:hypothetical protein
MPDVPLLGAGTPMRVRRSEGSRLACAAFYPSNDDRNATHFAGIVNSSDRLHHHGPDLSEETVRIAASCPDVEKQGCCIAYFEPDEAFLKDPTS